MRFPTESTTASANIGTGTGVEAHNSSWPTPDTEHGAMYTGTDNLITQHQGFQDQESTSYVPPAVVYNSSAWTPTPHANNHASMSVDNDIESLYGMHDMTTNHHLANTRDSSFIPHQTWADIYGSNLQAPTGVNPLSFSPTSPVYRQTSGMLPDSPMLGYLSLETPETESQGQSLEHESPDNATADGVKVQPNITPRPSPFPPQVGTPPADAYNQYKAARPNDFRSPAYSQQSEEENPVNDYTGQTRDSELLAVKNTSTDQNVFTSGPLASPLLSSGYVPPTQGFATHLGSGLRPQMQQNYYNPSLLQYPYHQLPNVGQYPPQIHHSMDPSLQLTLPSYTLGQVMQSSHGLHMPTTYNGSFNNSTPEAQNYAEELAKPSHGVPGRQSAQYPVPGFNLQSNANNVDFASQAQLQAYLQQYGRNVAVNTSQFAPGMIRIPAGQSVRPGDPMPSIGYHSRPLTSAQNLFGPDSSRNAESNLRTRVPLSQYFASGSTSQPQTQGGDPRFAGRNGNTAPYTGSDPRDYKLRQTSSAATTTGGLQTHHAHPRGQRASSGTYGLNPILTSPGARNPLPPFNSPVNPHSPPKAAFLPTNRITRNPSAVRRDQTRRVTDTHSNPNRPQTRPQPLLKPATPPSPLLSTPQTSQALRHSNRHRRRRLHPLLPPLRPPPLHLPSQSPPNHVPHKPTHTRRTPHRRRSSQKARQDRRQSGARDEDQDQQTRGGAECGPEARGGGGEV